MRTLCCISGDRHLQAILRGLRNKGFDDLIKWRPKNPMIKSHRSEIIRWILHPSNVHKFRSKEVVETTSHDSSVWWGLVTDVFPQSRNKKRVHARIVQNLSCSTRSSDSSFGSFVAAVINAHNTYCRVRHGWLTEGHWHGVLRFVTVGLYTWI